MSSAMPLPHFFQEKKEEIGNENSPRIKDRIRRHPKMPGPEASHLGRSGFSRKTDQQEGQEYTEIHHEGVALASVETEKPRDLQAGGPGKVPALAGPRPEPRGPGHQCPRAGGDGHTSSSTERTGPPSAFHPGQAVSGRRGACPHRRGPSPRLGSLNPKVISSRNTRPDTPRHAVLPVPWAPLGPVEWTHKINHHRRQWAEAAEFHRVARIS